ncbi:chemotaxis-specific protein-glutamate methyltransferase CheB [Acetobacteraceae bacterium KSS8]|uniref:Protein-glutamate methylesterase/protein-glutamine glutaminase n=1 Tax=Endosaccharibacter trunci TaxID=2812733 RepID=A0ABT1W8K5_9PROT|nr:chemotaxis-specific protein-glutamate methyltransferase CheB [Acetobacteraceae bacterium KSS8]
MTGRPAARVLVVEDSPVIRRLLTHIIQADPRLTLAGAVETAEAALAAIPTLRPDVISMDIRLPGMDGLEATRRIMAEFPTPIVVIADAVEDVSLRISMNALRSGALAVVEKPGGLFDGGAYPAAARTIATQLAIMSEVPVIRRRGTAIRPEPPPERVGGLQSIANATVMGLAASTGGPQALARLLGRLPENFPLPILLVQHIGAPFVEGFADWLNGLIPPRVSVAQDNEQLEPGHVYVAPGEKHLTLSGSGLRARLDSGGPVSGQRPSATVLFDSLARLGPDALGVLLTGMGDDGAAGLVAMRRQNAATITEHESTAVVYGMPAVAVRLGGSCASLPIDEIAPAILGQLGARVRSAAR